MPRKHLAPENDYFVVILPDPSAGWTWEIRRKSHPLGVKMHAGGFASRDDARLAGESALDAFLRRLAQDEG
jgi:hypothetical protein